MTILRTIAISIGTAALLSFIALGQTAPAKTGSAVTSVVSPAGPESLGPNLSAGKDGRTYLSWVEAAGKGHALRFSTRLPGGAWSRPSTIAQGENWFVSYADFPSMLVLPNGALAANWLVNINPVIEAYKLNVTLSADAGKTWSRPIVPHRDGTENQHGFLSMVPGAAGGLLAVWLDGRKMDDSLEMSLMYTTIAADGKLGPEVTVDGRVCDCCQTSAVATPDGMAVAYRDRSDKEVRDISVVRLSNGRWSQPQTVFNDGWEIDGCPINGPSIAASGSTLSVAWFTGGSDPYKVETAFAVDGVKFGQPIRVDDGNPLGRVDVVALSPTESLVSWVERTDKNAQIRARRVKADGTRGPATVISEISSSVSSGFPQMEKSGNEVVFAWTEIGKATMVRTAVMQIGAQ